MRLFTLATAVLAVATLGPAASAQSRQRLTPPKPAETSSSFTPGIVADGSFEGGTPNTAWAEASVTYDTPVCSVALCGTGGGTAAPRTGTYYVWFGGASAGDVGSMTQTVTIPSAPSASLKFYLKIPVIAAGGTGFVAASIDGTEVFRATYAANQATYTDYTLVTVPINSYANGASHVLSLTSTTTGSGNFYVDDVSIEAGVTGPGLSSSPSSLAFGTTTPVGTPSATQTVTLSNGGTTATTVTSITSSNAAFTVQAPTLPLTIAAGATATFTVRFTPTNSTAQTGTISVASNAPGSPLTIALTGTGFVAPTAPANDNVANAIALTTATGTFNGTNVAATLETGEPVPTCQTGQNNSVWWKLTPATAGTLTVDLSSSTFDTVLTFHQPGTTQIACDDDGATTPNTLASILTNIAVTAGQPVLIRVAGYQTGTAIRTGDIVATYSFSGTIATAGEGTAATGRTALTASPNPLRGMGRVSFVSATAADVTVAVYDVTGRQVATLFQGAVAADQTVDASLDATSLPAGVYVVRATGADLNLTQRVTVVR